MLTLFVIFITSCQRYSYSYLLLPTPFGSLLQQPPFFPPNRARPMPPTPQPPSPRRAVLGKSGRPWHCFFQHSNGGSKWPQAVPKVSHKSAKGLQNGAEMGLRAAPESAPARRPCKKECNVQSVHYLLCFRHIDPPRKITLFLPLDSPKRMKNRVYDRGR